MRAVAAFTTLILGTMFAVPAVAADGTTPDFSGMWGRNAFNFEPLEGAPQPVVNLSRMPDGTSNIGQLVGDYRNPILHPQIADIVNPKGHFSPPAPTYPAPSTHFRPTNPP